ncbi:hypothetical protein C1645_823514 [Glomus cerebriforme]|uniref:Uncharacterized protein n=1 Tax=Glomus cerebriforme TaxID=658196 RepID=A0A397SXA2_9GLOM|nr:hypothetical protein C1645_823514 [Glomus cerebriforme]
MSHAYTSVIFVYIIDKTSSVHENIISQLQNFFKVPNNVYNKPSGNGVENAPDVCVSPNVAITSPSNIDGNPYAQIMCKVTMRQSCDKLGQKCLT